MNNLKNDLIRLGNQNPKLRKHLRPVLSSLGKLSLDPSDVDISVRDKKRVAQQVEQALSSHEGVDLHRDSSHAPIRLELSGNGTYSLHLFLTRGDRYDYGKSPNAAIEEAAQSVEEWTGLEWDYDIETFGRGEGFSLYFA